MKLHDDLNWFVLCPEIRVMHIETGATERAMVLEQVAQIEFHGDNRAPFFVLEDAHTQADGGWDARAERVRVIHEMRREAMEKEPLRPAPLPPLPHSGNSLATMATQLVQCLEAQKGVPELFGLVVILAPTVLEDPREFADAVHLLARRLELSQVRFIVVELGDAAAVPLVGVLGEIGMRAACMVNPAQQRKENTERLAAIANAPPGASREVNAGGAGPRDRIAPPRARQLAASDVLSPETAERIAKELGPAAALLGASGALLQRRITGAALAVQEQRFVDAVRLQSEACEQCWHAGLARMGCILEASLAGYCLAAGDMARARQAFDVSAKRAEAHGLCDIAAQALAGLAAVMVLQGDLNGGSACYARAGDMAERGQVPLLAMETFRLAGQFALRVRAEAAAIAAWQRALRVAAYAGPEVAAASSAPIVARALAKVMHDRGAHTAAQSLLAQADDYERPSAAAPSGEGARSGAADAALGEAHAGE